MCRSLKSFVYLLFCFFILQSCADNANPQITNLNDLLNSATLEPSADNLRSYFDAATSYITENKADKNLIRPIMEQASKFAIDKKQYSKSTSFLMPLLKNYKENCKTEPGHTLALANAMNNLNKKHAAQIIYRNYKDLYGGAPIDVKLENILTEDAENVNVFIDTLFQGIFKDPDQYGLNRAAALRFVDAVEAYALSNPCGEGAAENLYRASEIARSIRTLPKTMSIYDWILEDYPDFEKTPTVYFLKGFILENNVEDDEAAKEIYESFLEKYPSHDLADDVKFLLENMGRSDEEILEFLEQKQQEAVSSDSE